MPLQNVIQQLQEVSYKDKVLTIYLNTDRAQCQNGSWKIRLKNGLKKLEEYIQLSETEQLKSFKKMKRKVEREIEGAKTKLQKGVIIFASLQDKLFSVHYLQLPIETEFFWENKPELSQLKTIANNYPTSGVLIANDDELVLMHSELGQVEAISRLNFEAYTDDWRVFEGVAASERAASGANHRDQFQERYEANQKRWLRNMLPVVERIASKYNWKFVHIIGQAEYLSTLENELQLPIKNILRKTVSDVDQKKLIYKEIIAV